MEFPDLYFAYGSNLCVDQMRDRCPDARPIGAAILHDHRLHFPRRSCGWGNAGVAGVTPHEGEKVEGALYRLTHRCRVTLDSYEGVSSYHYYPGIVDAHGQDGRVHQALTYFAYDQPGGPFHPSREYVDVMIAGAMAHGLSEAWHAWLRSLQPTPLAEK